MDIGDLCLQRPDHASPIRRCRVQMGLKLSDGVCGECQRLVLATGIAKRLHHRPRATGGTVGIVSLLSLGHSTVGDQPHESSGAG